MAKNNELTDTLIDIGLVSLGIVGSVATGQLLKPATGYDFTPLLQMAGGGTAAYFAPNKRVKMFATGVAAGGGVRFVAKTFPKVGQLAGWKRPQRGLACPDCGGTCKGKGLGCPQCNGKCGAMKGLGQVNEWQTVYKENVSREDMLTLPNADAELLNLIPNENTFGGFLINKWGALPQENQFMKQWDVIYNFFPKLFSWLLNGSPRNRFNAKIYKRIDIKPSKRLAFGRLTDLPFACADVQLTYDESISNNSGVASGVYASPITMSEPDFVNQGEIVCSYGDQCPTTNLTTGMVQVQAFPRNEGSNNVIDFVLNGMVDFDKYVYYLEASDGSRIYMQRPYQVQGRNVNASLKVKRNITNLRYRLFLFSKEYKSGRRCIYVTPVGSVDLSFPVTDTSNQPSTSPNPLTPTSPQPPTQTIVGSSASLSLTGQDAVMVNETVNLRGVYGEGIAKESLLPVAYYEWDLGDGTPRFTTPDPNVDVIYDGEGSYTVTLCAYFKGDPNPLCTQHQVNVIGTPTVTPPPPDNKPIVVDVEVPLRIEGNQTTKTGVPETFCVVNDNYDTLGLGLAETGIEWTWNDGQTDVTLNNDFRRLCTTRIFDQPGTYTVRACFTTEIGLYAPSGKVCLDHTIVVNTPDVPTPPVIVPEMFDFEGNITPTGGATKLVCKKTLPVTDVTVEEIMDFYTPTVYQELPNGNCLAG